MNAAEYKRVFNLPFTEASAFFRGKLNIPTARWDDLWKDQHAKGFMIAGATKAELLADFRGAVQKAVDGSMTLKEFRDQFDTIVERHGWSYNGGRNWRTSVIYNTNVRTAYMAGRWQQLAEPGSKMPYLMYRHADGVRNPRPLHVAWNGLVLAADHAFWKTNYPPNGWGCHCTVFAASEKERQAAVAAGRGEPQAGWDAPDPKTGAPKGIDKGWDYNVGQAMFKWQPDLDKYDYPIAKALVGELTDNKVFNTWHDFTRKRVTDEMAKPDFPTLDKEGTIKELRKRLTSDERYPVAVLPENIKTLIGANTQGVYLSLDDLIKQQMSRQGQDFEAFDYIKAQTVIEEAKLIVQDTDTVSIFVSDTTGNWYAAVLKTAAAGKEVFLKSFRRSSEKNMLALKKRGVILLG